AIEADGDDRRPPRLEAAHQRSPESEADSAQPVEQRAEIHPPRQRDHQWPCRYQGAARRAVGRRHGHRYCAGRPGSNLRGLSSARQFADARVRRHRSRPVDLPAARADARRGDHGAQYGGQGFHLPVDVTDQGAEMTTKADRPRVLLVDDYPDAREMYTEYLQYSGF